MRVHSNALYFAVVGLSSTSAVLAAVDKWGQCGGNNYSGDTTCADGWYCEKYNEWYSQCIEGPGDSTEPSNAPAPAPASSSQGAATSAPRPSSAPSAAPVPSSNGTAPDAPPPSSQAPTTLETRIASSTPEPTVEANPEPSASASASAVEDEEPPTSSSATAAVPSPSTGAGAGNGTTTPGTHGESCSLNAAFTAAGKKYFGVATDRGLLSTSPNADIIKADFGQVTPENSMKWDTLEPSEGTFNFAPADALVAFAEENNMLVRGHGPVWHSQLPSWVSQITDKAKLEEVMVNHVTKLMTQYKGKVYAYDVVNEILAENGSLRSSVFYNVLGDSFVATAFAAARAADPDAKLYINDYNLDSATYTKTSSMASKVKQWIADGVPIDGIGSQAHLNNAWPISDFPAALKSICEAAPECAVTELDIKGASSSDYEIAVKACLDIANCVGVTVWGLSDKDSWRKDTTPLLFDASFQAKEAYNGVCGILTI